MSYGMSKQEAEAFKVTLEPRVGGYFEGDSNKIITGFEVRPYPGTKDYGVVTLWRYAGRPDLGQFGGAFVWRD